jgi:hypothetical protein
LVKALSGQELIPIDLVAVELGAIDAGEADLAAKINSFQYTHLGARCKSITAKQGNGLLRSHVWKAADKRTTA